MSNMWFLRGLSGGKKSGKKKQSGLSGLSGVKAPTDRDIAKAKEYNDKFDELTIPRYAVCGGAEGVMFKAIRPSCNDKANISGTGKKALDNFLQKTYGFSFNMFENEEVSELKKRIAKHRKQLEDEETAKQTKIRELHEAKLKKLAERKRITEEKQSKAKAAKQAKADAKAERMITKELNKKTSSATKKSIKTAKTVKTETPKNDCDECNTPKSAERSIPKTTEPTGNNADAMKLQILQQVAETNAYLTAKLEKQGITI